MEPVLDLCFPITLIFFSDFLAGYFYGDGCVEFFQSTVCGRSVTHESYSKSFQSTIYAITIIDVVSSVM